MQIFILIGLTLTMFAISIYCKNSLNNSTLSGITAWIGVFMASVTCGVI